MGNDNSKTNNTNYNELENAKRVLKGSFKDRYKVDHKDPLRFYDMIIDIDSFSKKPEIIWKIKTKKSEKNEDAQIIENENNQEVHDLSTSDNSIEKIIDNKQENCLNIIDKNSIIIGVIGLGNVGKSYLLSLFTGEELPTGDSIHTKGISIKKKGKLIILDSEGVEAPLTKRNISKDLYPKEDLLDKEINESDHLIQMIAKDKKAVELFIQDFIIEKSNILFIVVGQLTLSEQKLINRIVNEANKSLIFVIHNLKNLYSKEQIEFYIENTFKKNIFLNFEKFTQQKYKDKSNSEFNSYFVESYKTSDGSNKQVIHLIMASNVKESEAYYYNKTVLDYVRTEISSYNEGKNFNLVEELKNFVLHKAEKYTESEKESRIPITEEDIKIEVENGEVSLKIKNNTRLKKCLINQLGFSSFYGELYSPNYVCYFEKSKNENEKKFVIEINLCGTDLFVLDKPKREEIVDEGHKTIISFTGTKKLREYKNLQLQESSTMDSGNFRIDIVLDMNKYKFKQGAKVSKKKDKGIIRYIYTLEDNNNNNSEMKVLNFEIKEKPKK